MRMCHSVCLPFPVMEDFVSYFLLSTRLPLPDIALFYRNTLPLPDASGVRQRKVQFVHPWFALRSDLAGRRGRRCHQIVANTPGTISDYPEEDICHGTSKSK
ncbi:hypothetical protein ABZX51_004200 [Aspergillus tubingensis]